MYKKKTTQTRRRLFLSRMDERVQLNIFERTTLVHRYPQGVRNPGTSFLYFIEKNKQSKNRPYGDV